MEIEVKFRVNDFSFLRDKLKSLNARFLGRFHEKDTYFTPFSESESLRVRTSESGKKLTYKRLFPNDETQSALELEVEVAGDIEEILRNIGHKEVVSKEKFREMYSVDGTTVNLDRVTGLGSFVEIEFIGDQEQAEQKLKSVAEKLGLDWEARITSPYIRQLLELNK